MTVCEAMYWLMSEYETKRMCADNFIIEAKWIERKQAIADLDEMLGTDLWMQRPNSPKAIEMDRLP